MVFTKTEYIQTPYSSNFASRYVPNINVEVSIPKELCKNVYSCLLIVKSRKQAKCPSTIEQINHLVHSHCGVLYGDEKEQTTATCNNMDEFHKHNFEQKKPGTTEYTTYDSI